MSGIPKEEMSNASSIYNLLRNLGGSFGVAFVTTILARRAQFHQSRLVEHATPYDPNFQIAMQQNMHYLQSQGVPPSQLESGSLAMIYQELLRQASMLSFNDAFLLTCGIMLLMLPFIQFMKRPRGWPDRLSCISMRRHDPVMQ